MLVYKFLHSGNPKYFEPFLIPRYSAYNTRQSQSDGIFLEVPHFASVFKSRKHFGLSFAYDAPMIWNDLPDEVSSANSLASFRSKLKSYLFGKAYPPSISNFLLLSPRCWPLQCLWFLNIEQCFCVMRLRICLLTEIKCYKSAIRIRILERTVPAKIYVKANYQNKTSTQQNYIINLHTNSFEAIEFLIGQFLIEV